MGGIFGGSGAGGNALPAMSGFDANAVAQALGAVGGNAQSGVRPGVPASAMGMVNPLAQMLAQVGPQYQPGDTRWGQAGDRLLRYTPQEGNVRDGTQSGGAGGGGAGALPGSSVGPSGPVTIDWGKLQSAMQTPTTNPPGAPAINTAMEKLRPAPIAGERPADVMEQAVAAQKAWRQAVNSPHGTTKAEKAAWYDRVTAAQNAYVAAQKATGLGPGADPYSPFAPGQVGSL